MHPAALELVRPPDSPSLMAEGHVQNSGWEQQDSLGKDDRHNTGIIDLQGHVLGLTSIDLTAYDTLSILNADPAGGLSHGNDRSDHDKEEGAENHQNYRTDIGGLAIGRHKSTPGLDQTGWQLGKNTDGDDHGDSVADSPFGDLIPHPHQEKGTRCHDEHGEQAKGDTRIGNQGNTKACDRVCDPRKEGIGLGAFKRKSQKPSLKDAKQDCGVTCVLGDLLTPPILTRKASEFRNHRTKKQKHDRGTDIGHDPEGENGTIP